MTARPRADKYRARGTDYVARGSRNLTYEQVQGRKDKAVRFLRDVLDDAERADEVEAESVEDYAARRHFVLSNPRKRGGGDGMASKRELQEQVDELQDYVDDLEGKLDQIANLSASEGEDEDEEDGDNGDDR